MAEGIAVFLIEIWKFGEKAKYFGEMASKLGQIEFSTLAWVSGENTLPPGQLACSLRTAS